MKELDNKILYISDADISEEEVPILCRFLCCKQAHTEIKSVHLVRTEHSVEVKKKNVGRKVTDVTQRLSVLNHDNSKLFKSVIDCISKCEKLEMITVSGVQIPSEIFEIFGKALVKNKSGELFLYLSY